MKKSLLKLALGFTAITFALASFGQTYNFTNAGATGQNGPTQAQVNAAYAATNLNNQVTVTATGIQQWTVPATGNYSIEASGAQGGDVGGLGATMFGEFALVAGDVIKIIVGQEGGTTNNIHGSGGGGSFVVLSAGNTPLIVAGGGGGHGASAPATVGPLSHGSVLTAGQSPTGGGPGGVNGGGGASASGNVGGTANTNGAPATGSTWASGGGGLLTHGGTYNSGGTIGGQSFVSGGLGGAPATGANSAGGFGGGGGAGDRGAGAGGYSGGGGATNNSQSGGGGGSFNSGTNQTNTGGINSGMGSVTIISLCPVTSGLVLDAAVLPDLNDVCSITPTAPTATNNCGSVIGSSNVPFPITAQGTTVITWTYFDGTNTLTQMQNVILNDVTPPTFDLATLPDSTYWCKALVLDIPTATDNCDGPINGTTTTVLPITTGGLNVVTWTYTDANGNSVTQTQNITVDVLNNGISQLDPTTITADGAGYTYIWLDCDNGNAIIPGATSQTYSPTIAGNYAAVLFFNGCSDTTDCISFWPVGVNESESLNNVSIYPNPTNGLVQINLGDHNGSINYSISTVDGRIVTNKTKVISNNISVDLSDESKGIYFLKVEDQSSSKVYKIIKE